MYYLITVFEPLNETFWIPDALLIVIHWGKYQSCVQWFVARGQPSLGVKFS